MFDFLVCNVYEAQWSYMHLEELKNRDEFTMIGFEGMCVSSIL